jgi:hypothetical protein
MNRLLTLCGLCISVCLALCMGRPTYAGGDRTLAGASDGMHAWFVVERTRAGGTEWVLLHHATAMNCDCVREAFTLPRAPEAMSALRDTLWIVLPPDSVGARRDVYSVRAVRNPATGAFYSDPPTRMAIHPSLPGDGELRGLAAIEDGVLVLRSATAGATLEELGSRGWRAVIDPPATAGMRLTSIAGRPVLVDAAGATTVRAADGRWGSSGNAAAGPGFMQLISGASRGTALMRLEGGQRAVDYLSASGPLRLATFEAPDRAFTVLGLGDGFAIFVPTGEGGAAMQRIDSVGGVVGPLVVMGAQPSDATAWVCLAAVVVGSVGAASGALLRRSWRLKSAAAERR